MPTLKHFTPTLLILSLLISTLRPLSAAATPDDADCVGFGADELLPQTPRALELARQAASTGSAWACTGRTSSRTLDSSTSRLTTHSSRAHARIT